MNKRTKALNIPPKVKKAVFERDGGLCIICHRPGDPVCHFVPRSHGGLGIEENIVTLCPSCHRTYDQTTQRPILRPEIMEYLRKKYPNWDDVNLTYVKGN